MIKFMINSFNTVDHTFANSVDPDEMACNKPSHLDLHYLQLCFRFFAVSPIVNNGHAKIQRWNSLTQKLRVERVNNLTFYI